jgi:DNA repair exonuclease SbcCD ATPase subunit
VSAVTITPDGNAVVIGGKNGAGKSSVLDAIMYALAGGKSLPTVPIRNGEKSGKVEVKLSADFGTPALKVTRVFTAKGSRLEVRYDDEMRAKVSNPQALLDSLCGRVAFDPLAFTRAKPAEQAEQLRQLVGLDFSTLDADRQRHYEQRTERNRQVKAMRARLDAMPRHDYAPEEPVVVAELLEQLEAAEITNDDARNAERAAKQAADEAMSLDKQIAEMEAALVAARQRREELCQQADELHEVADAAQYVDTTAIHERIRKAEIINAQVRENLEREQLEAALEATEDGSKVLTQSIEEIDAQKQRMLADAKWPVPGLGFNEDGVTLNGLPFDQASQAEQLRVSVAMGFAANPKLRVILLRDASLLDADSLAMVAAMAEEADGQVWLETVSVGEQCSVRAGRRAREAAGEV